MGIGLAFGTRRPDSSSVGLPAEASRTTTDPETLFPFVPFLRRAFRIKRAATGDELAYLAAATRSFDLDSMTLRLLGEAAYLRHCEGGPDDAPVLTGSAAFEVEPLTYIATYTQQLNFVSAGPDTNQRLADFEIEYAPDEGSSSDGAREWSFAAAYRMPRGKRRIPLACGPSSVSAATSSLADSQGERRSGGRLSPWRSMGSMR